MTRSEDITPDCESYFSMENGNDSHTLIVQTLPPRPGERHARTCGKAVQATSSRASIPSLSVFERRQRLNQLPVRAGRRAPRAMEREGGKRKEALTPQNDKAALGGSRERDRVLLCWPCSAFALHSPPTILIFSLNFRSLGSHHIEACDYHHRLRDGYCRKAAAAVRSLCPSLLPGFPPQMWS